jgi:hypothetical protein
MCDDPNLTAQQILRRLNDKVSRFNRENQAQHPEACAFAFEINLMDFFEGVAAWGEDLPQLPPHRRGEGNTQPEPSKNRLHTIKELEQVSAFLLENLERRPNQPLKLTKLEGRQCLSVYACRELVHRAFGTLAIMTPARDLEQGARLELSETRMFGWNSEENDVHRMKRAFTAAASDPIELTGMVQAHNLLLRETAEQLAMASDEFRIDIPIALFVATMDRSAMANLARGCQLAARDLQIAFGLWDRKKDPQRNKTVTDFERPAPLYQFAMALLEQGWPCFGVASTENQRLMAGDFGADSFERRFSVLVSQIVECTPRLARELYQRNDFDPLVGIDAATILKHERPPARSDLIAWQIWAARAARHFAARIVKAREQIIVLRDYAETTRRLNEDLAARARIDKKLRRDRNFFNKHGVAEIYAWLRECQRQYRQGIFYPSDRKRDHDYFEVLRLNVDLLRHDYPQRHQAGPRFADVPVEKTKAIIDSLHPAETIRRRLGRILSRLENQS